MHVVDMVAKPICWLEYFFKQFRGVFLLLGLMNEAIEEKGVKTFGTENRNLFACLLAFS